MINILSNSFFKNHFLSDFIRFIGWGLINTLSTIVIYQFLLFFLNYKLSYAISWAIGILIVFLFYPSHVFKKPDTKLLNKFFIVLFYLIVFVLSSLLLNYLIKHGIKRRVAIFFVAMFSVVINFVGMRAILWKDDSINTIFKALEYLEYNSKKIEEFCLIDRKTITQFWILFAIALFFYFAWLNSLLISIDGEFSFHRMSSASTYSDITSRYNIWINQGRWTVHLIEKYIFPQQIIPFLPYIIFCFFISLSYLILLKVHKLSLNNKTFLAFPIFCAFPTWNYIVEFTSNLTSVGFGVFLTSLSTYLVQKSINLADLNTKDFIFRPNYIFATISAVLLTTSIGIYQSFVLMFLCFNLGRVTLNIYSKQNINFYTIARTLFYIFCVCSIGIFMYFVISYVFLTTTNESLQYVQMFWQPELLVSQTYFVITKSLNMLRDCYLGSAKIYGVSIFGVGAITILGFTSLIFSGPVNKSLSFNFILLLVITVLPFSTNFVAGGFMPPRLLIAMPYVIWLFAIIVFENKYAFIRILAYIFVIILNLQILYAFNTYAATRELRKNHDNFMAHDLYLRIAKVHNNFDLNKKYYVHFYGRKVFNNPYPNVPNTFIDVSLLGYQWATMERTYLYMLILGYSNLILVDRSQNPNFQQYYLSMPSWPNEGCVKVVGDVTLIKLNDEVMP